MNSVAQVRRFLRAVSLLSPDVSSVVPALQAAGLERTAEGARRLANVTRVVRVLEQAIAENDWDLIEWLASKAGEQPVMRDRAGVVREVRKSLAAVRSGTDLVHEAERLHALVSLRYFRQWREWDAPFFRETLAAARTTDWNAAYVAAALSIRVGAFGDAEEPNEPASEARARIAKLYRHAVKTR